MKHSKKVEDKRSETSSSHDIDDESEVISQRDTHVNNKQIQQSLKMNHGSKESKQSNLRKSQNKEQLFEMGLNQQYNINSSLVDTSQLNYHNQHNPNEKTDVSQTFMLNQTNVSNNNMLPDMIFDDNVGDYLPDSNPPRFREINQKDALLDSQSLNFKMIKSNKENPKGNNYGGRIFPPSAEQDMQPQNGEYLSENMVELKTCLDLDDERRFEQVLEREVYDSEEVLMYLYAALSCFNSDRVFHGLLKSSNYFEFNNSLNSLFQNQHIFMLMQGFSPSAQRRQFDCIVLRISLERDFYFMTDKILDRSAMSKEMIQILLQENQKKLLVQQLSKPKRPTYLDVDHYNLAIKGGRSGNGGFKNNLIIDDIERDIHFNDIIYAALDLGESSNSIIEVIKLMKNEVQAKYFEDPEKEFSLKDLYRIFIIRRKIKLLRFLFSLLNEFDFTPQLFIEALELESFDMGALLYQEFFRRLKDSKKENEYIITILISSLNKNNGQLDFKAYLIRSYLDQFILRHAKTFLDTLDQKIQQENKFNILVLNLNLVKSACLLIEILELMGDRFERLKVRCQTLRGKIEQIAKKYMLAIETEQEMRYLLLEKDFENRDSLELITRFKITPMLESQFADNVVREIWRSPYSTNNSLFSASTNHRLTFYYWNCIKDDELTSRFYHYKDLNSFEAHPLQFTVWRFSGKSRILVDFFATGIIAAVIHILINTLLQESAVVDGVLTPFFELENKLNSIKNITSPEYLSLQTQYRTSYAQMSDSANIFFQKVLVVSYVSLMPLLFAFQHIFNIVYASINKRMVDPYAFLNLLDLSIFGVFFANIIITYCKNLYGTWMDYPRIGDETRAVVYCRNYYGGVVSEDALWICCIVILWVRVFYLLRYNEFMGKFMGIIERLIYDVALFFCFYIIQLIFFALVAELCFRRLTDYNTSYKAFKTLFYASMGQFSFDEMKDADYGEYFGITYLIVFLVCNIGIIMNLFISVISVLYDSFSEHQNVYQMLETLKLRSYTQADKEYSALVSIPPPLNILLVIFAPFLLTTRNPQKLNEALLCFAYLPTMFAVTLLFLIYQICLIPVTYIKLFFHKLVMIYVYSKSYRVSRADKFITFTFFVFFGPFSLAINAIVDVWYFLCHLWLRDMPKTKHKTSQKQLSKSTLQILNIYFKAKHDKILPYKKVAVDLRDDLQIIQGVSNIIRPGNVISFLRNTSLVSVAENELRSSKLEGAKYQMMDESSLNQMFHSINEYTVIKQVLEGNSDLIRINESNQIIKTVDCKILHTMISDLYRFKSVLKVVDEDYIFVRRAVNIKSLNQQQLDKRRKYLESDKSDQQPLNVQVDSEISRESKNRQKILFKKLLFLNTKRILSILHYKTGETEQKKLLFAMEREDGLHSKNNVLKNIRNSSFSNNKRVLQPFELDGLEEKVYQMGNINPFFNTTLEQMKTEIQNLCLHLSNIQSQQKQVSEKEKNYQGKINQLYLELQDIKEEKENVKNRTQNVIEDYFYDRKQSQKLRQADQNKNKPPNEQQQQIQNNIHIIQSKQVSANHNQQAQPQSKTKDSKDSQEFKPWKGGQYRMGQPSPQKNSKTIVGSQLKYRETRNRI